MKQILFLLIFAFPFLNCARAIEIHHYPRKIVTSASANYTVKYSDSVIMLSGASFTVTLPTAVGYSGEMFTLIHNGTSLTDVYTLNTTSSQTIGGIASGSYALYTVGESLKIVSDGANWQILNHYTNTDLNYYTPTFTGIGTPSYQSIYWYRRGQYMHIGGIFTTGTVSSSTATMSLPSGATARSMPTTASNYLMAGSLISNVTGGYMRIVTFQGFSNTVLNFNVVYPSATNELSGASGTIVFNNGETDSFGDVKVPISGWEP